MVPLFESTFMVSMTCQSCIDDISQSVRKVEGVSDIEADLEKQIVHVTGSAVPSAVVAAIQKTGRDAILRGSGKPNCAAVSILETYAISGKGSIRGLARMIQVGENQTLIDLTLNGLKPGEYVVSINRSGDLSEGPESTGDVWEKLSETASAGDVSSARGALGVVTVDESGQAGTMIDKAFSIWEVIGLSVVVAPLDGTARKDDMNSLAGVVARSAGVWENDKIVCSCSGQSVWEERKEWSQKGVV